MHRCLAPLLSNGPAMQDTYVVSFNAPEIASAAQPGQFVMIKCGSGHQPLWRRPLSLHRVNRETGEVALLYALAGQGTRWLSSRRPGETVDVLGPLGHGFELPAERKSLLLVAGGRGIAPLAFLAEEALAQGCPVTLLHGAASASCLSDHATLPDGVRVVEATEDGSRGENGLATQVLPRLLPGKDLVYACGPMGMYRAMASLGLQVPVQVLVETPMACGFGGCYGCAVRTVHGIRLACKDGPCFRLDELMW